MNLTINGRQVTVDDGFRNLSREDQDATVEEIASSMPKSEPSGVMAGAQHGVSELINGPAETLKRFAGVGAGRKDDPNYVPADITHGSFNPLNWSPSQIPQKVAEMAPSLGPDLVAGSVGGKIGKSLGGVKGAALGALLGAAASGWARTAGDTAKEATVARTGDPTADSSTADLVRGGATAGAASLAGALLPTRFVPGLNTVTKDVVGSAGAVEAAKRLAATAGLGAAGSVGSNAATQAGLTVGTDKGLTVDPSQFPEAAVGGAATGAVMGAPKFVGDAVRAGTLAKFGGDNLLPTKNVATRLEAASDNLGNAKSDESAYQRVTADLQHELGAAASNVRKQVQLSPEAENALASVQRGGKITPAEVQLIKTETAGAPDGANTAFLAHSLHVADLMGDRGGHSNRGWAGGISGVMDKNLGFLLNPARLAGGAAATALGMHLLGTSNPLFAGGLAGTYLGARGVDAMTGMRSPAKTYAEHFADHNATLRMPTTPNNSSAPPPPTGGGGGPWGPRPAPTTSVPPVQPQAPAGAPSPWGPRPAPTTSVPPVQPQAPAAPPAPNPIAAVKAMLQQRAYLEKVKANSTPPEPQAPAAPEPINPLMLPRDITTPSSNLMKGFRNTGKMANTYDTATRKAEGVAQAEALAANSPTINEQGGLSALITPEATKHGSEILKAATLMRKLGAAGPEEAAAAKAEQAQAKSDAREAKAAEKAQARSEAQAQTAAERAQAKAERARVVADNAAAKAEKEKAKEAAKAEQVKAKAAAATAKEAAQLANAKLKAVRAAPAANSLGAAATPTKIKKTNGKVEEPAKPPKEEASTPFEPIDEEHLYAPGITAKQYAQHEAERYGASSPRYKDRAEQSAKQRIDAADDLTGKFPQYKHAIHGLLRQLHAIGRNPTEIAKAVNHYADHVPDDVGHAIREAFK